MKTTFLLAASFFMLTSCKKKDWNCTCNVNGDVYSQTITNSTNSNANSSCNEYGKSIGQSYGSYTYKCEIK